MHIYISNCFVDIKSKLLIGLSRWIAALLKVLTTVQTQIQTEFDPDLPPSH